MTRGTAAYVEQASFNVRAREALSDKRLREAVAYNTGALGERRKTAIAEISNFEQLRDAAAVIRESSISRLGALLDRWSQNLTSAGGRVHWARNAEEAVAAVRSIVARKSGEHGTIVAKGKSMASEEIHLNEALAEAGDEVVETDLGEFIIQLAKEPPSHIIAPALHKDRFEVADLFSTDGGKAVSAEIPEEASYARERLRKVFLDAGVGITGVNFAVAETGSICLVENEGNGRMCSSLPPVHVAIMGMERIVGSLEELDVMLNLLARSATGQGLTVYTNLITGPRREGEADGPEELHVIVLDGGRRAALDNEFSSALNCIRCGACLNVCPVYRQVGGHVYNSVYSGPIGAVLTPILRPDDPTAAELPEASSLCGACTEVCPVQIPLHDLLARLRAEHSVKNASRTRRWGFRLWSLTWSRRWGWKLSLVFTRLALRCAERFGALPALGWLGSWQKERDLPRITERRGDDKTREKTRGAKRAKARGERATKAMEASRS